MGWVQAISLDCHLMLQARSFARVSTRVNSVPFDLSDAGTVSSIGCGWAILFQTVQERDDLGWFWIVVDGACFDFVDYGCDVKMRMV